MSSLIAGGRFTGQLDECEDVIAGLHEAMALDWQAKTRMLCLICDAPPHGKRFSDQQMRKERARLLVQSGYVLYTANLQLQFFGLACLR